jgi:hypothetical protein
MKSRFLLLVALLFLLSGTPAFAQNQPPVANATAQNDSAALAASKQPQLPRLIRFSGSVTAADLRTIGMTFALYKNQQDRAPLWQEVQNVTPDAAGYYSVLLGANSKDGVPAELFASNEARWLGVQVEQEPEQPRVLLVSVPYALKAGDAETVGGHPLSDFVLTPAANASSTSSGSGGTTSSGGSTTVKKSATSPAVSSSPVTTAGGTQNFVAKFDSSGTNLINSSIFDNGNVGIGTSTPSAKLEVAGVIGEAFRMTGVGTNPVAFRFINAGNNPYFGTEGSTAGGYFSGSRAYSTLIYSPSQPIQNIIGGVARLTIDTNGNVGIGTSTPAARLDVTGAIGEAFRMTAGVGTSPVAFRFMNTGNSAYFGIESSTAGGFFTGSLPYSTVIYSPQAIQNIVGGVSRMIIHTNGNVGISTVSPTSPLTVAGTVESTSGGFKFPDGSVQSSALAARTRGITFLAGCDTCDLLADTDDQKAIYVNVIGAMTIQSVTCFSDAGAPIINLQRNGTAVGILNPALTCSTVGAPGSVAAGQNVLNLNDVLDFSMVSAGVTTHRVTVVIKALLN